MSASNLPEHSSALHTIASVSLDAESPLFQHYPAMKLGVRASVRYYAELLLPLAERIVASKPEFADWVITAPPLYAIPAGANLLSAEVFRNLQERVPASISLREVDLRYALPSPEGSGTGGGANDYSNSGVDDRIRNRKKLHEGKLAPKPDPADFRGRAVLFINDINVTGTQQHYIRKTLDPVQPAAIHWMYIFQVEPALGRSHPEIEHALNFLNLKTFDEFAEVVTSTDIDYTSRCVARLFSFSAAQLDPLFRRLDPSRRKTLYQLIVGEGKYMEPESQAKVALLQNSLLDSSG